MRRSFALAFAALAACAPPPLDADATGATVQFIFPTSDLEGPVCPSFLVAVDVDGHELVEADPAAGVQDGIGHWHLDDDITGDYYPAVEPWLEVDADLGGETTRAYRMTASLVNNDHSPLSETDHPRAIATVEFEVSSEDGCLGGAPSDVTTR